MISKILSKFKKSASDDTVLDTFDKARKYFQKNRRLMQKKHFVDREIFINIYNKMTKEAGDPSMPQKNGVAIGVLFRALKYLFSAIDLISSGHMDEGIILTRNAMELRVIALDIAFTDGGIKLWNLTQKEKEYIKRRDGNIIDSKKLKERIIEEHSPEVLGRLSYKGSLKRIKKSSVPEVVEMVGLIEDQYNDISEYRSHENIFNIVRRTDTVKNDSGNFQTIPYLGLSATSNTRPYFDNVLGQVKELEDTFDLIMKQVTFETPSP